MNNAHRVFSIPQQKLWALKAPRALFIQYMPLPIQPSQPPLPKRLSREKGIILLYHIGKFRNILKMGDDPHASLSNIQFPLPGR